MTKKSFEKLTLWIKSQWDGPLPTRESEAWAFLAGLDWNDFDTEAWSQLRDRALMSWQETNGDRERLRDGLKTSTIFGSALVTSIFGITKANFDNVTGFSLAALLLAGFGTGVAFLASGSLKAPSLPSIRVLIQGLEKKQPLIANDAVQLYAVIEDFRDSLTRLAFRDQQSKRLIFASIVCLLIEAFIVALRPS